MTTTPVTIEQAAALLNVSASTIRRRIRAGILQVEEARRPQGVVWLVHLPPGTAPASETATVDTAPVATTPTAPTPPGEAIAAMIQATLTPIIAPLLAEQSALRQTVERQAEQIAELREDRGRLTAELEAERGSHSPVAAQPESAPWRCALWPWLTLLAVVGAGALLLAWVR